MKQPLSVSIEPMRLADLEEVMRIDQRSYPVPWKKEAYLTELANRAAAYFVARSADRIMGYSGEWVIMDEAHITTLACEPLYRGRRVGEKLLTALIEEAQVRRASHITLEVREGNLPAQKLYEKYGFEPVGIRRSYYSDNGENAIVMWVSDILQPAFQQKLQQRKQLW